MKKERKEESNKYQKNGNILGINISSKSRSQVLRIIRRNLNEGKKFYLVTPNPEIILKAQKDKELAQVLNKAEIVIADGVGIAMAKKFLNLPNPDDPLKRLLTLFIQGLGVGFSVIFDREWLLKENAVIRGRELFIELVKLANKKAWKVYLLGDRRGSATLAENALKINYKRVKLFSSQGPNVNNQAEPISKSERDIEQKAIDAINQASPRLLFVAFGAPKQEKWVDKHLNKLNVGGAMVVGGAFNYLSGRAKLPPQWLSEVGLEWLWRLINEPKRFKRVLKAVVIFSFKVFLAKLNRNDQV